MDYKQVTVPPNPTQSGSELLEARRTSQRKPEGFQLHGKGHIPGNPYPSKVISKQISPEALLSDQTSLRSRESLFEKITDRAPSSSLPTLSTQR